ncbi:prefoldin subunit 2 [Notothenia coriiceps]|uniref:Prefoldin subunit 2 n=1 Tax=Notothenia coriiceps TaxID=8208 RepID=A0A6I9NQE2_9TELE|nr:PREDICTED: prefoldin subunit 2 [Notothenia coriiceps]
MAANSSSTVSKSSSGSSAGGKPSGPSAEQVVATFQRMRQEQRSMASKSADFEMDINEHSLVIETLKEVDPSRKCFRLVGGVLVERTVKEVLPALESNKEQVMHSSLCDQQIVSAIMETEQQLLCIVGESHKKINPSHHS